MMNQADIIRFLSAMAAAIPARAPDFARPEISQQWARALREHITSPAQCNAIFRVLTNRCKFFPAVAEIIEVANSKTTDKDVNDAVQRREQAQMKYDQALDRCTLCDNSGLVSARHLASDLNFCFRCGNCGSAGAFNYSAHIPVWDSRFYRLFETPRFAGYGVRSDHQTASKALTMHDLLAELDGLTSPDVKEPQKASNANPGGLISSLASAVDQKSKTHQN